MVVKAEDCVVKFSKLIEDNGRKDHEPSLMLSQKTINKLKTENMVLEGIENKNYPSNAKIEEFGVDLNFKGQQR